MALLADNIARLTSYLQAGNQQLDVARGTVLLDFVAAFSASATDTQNQTEATAAQGQLGTATGDSLTAKAADYSKTRIPAIAAIGPYVFGRNVADPSNAVTQGAGSIVQTQGGGGVPAVRFITLADATIPAGQTQSNSVYIQALIPGAAGNVGTGLVTVVQQPATGITSGTNTSPTTGGADQEADNALLVRVLGSLAPSNSPYAIQAAAEGVPGIFAARVLDWILPPINDYNGNYTCYCSDSSGNLSSGLQSQVTTAIAAVDGIGLQRHVQTFSVYSQSVYANLAVQPTAVYSAVAANVIAALTAYDQQREPGLWPTAYELQQVVDGSMPGFIAVPGVADFAVLSPSPTNPMTVGPYTLVRLPAGFPPQLTQVSL